MFDFSPTGGRPEQPSLPDYTFYLPLSWKDRYALRGLLRDNHENDPRLLALLERLERPRHQ